MAGGLALTAQSCPSALLSFDDAARFERKVAAGLRRKGFVWQR